MKDILTSPRIKDMKRKHRARQIRLGILFFILFVSIITALAYFSGNPRIIIKNVTVTGTRIIYGPSVEERVQQNLQGKYLKIFSRSNTLIYPHDQIYKDLLRAFPRIQTLSIYREKNWQTLHIDIAERAGSSLYCGETVPTLTSDIGENCYFVNNDGYIFDKAPYFSGNVYFKYYIPLTNGSNPLGQQMLSADRFHQIVRLVDKITDLGFKPIYLVMNLGGDNILYLNHSPTNTSPQIIFKDNNDLSTILDNLSLSMAKPEFANEINSKYTTLLYIDLRFNNKVLYKFQ